MQDSICVRGSSVIQINDDLDFNRALNNSSFNPLEVENEESLRKGIGLALWLYITKETSLNHAIKVASNKHKITKAEIGDFVRAMLPDGYTHERSVANYKSSLTDEQKKSYQARLIQYKEEERNQDDHMSGMGM